MTDKKYELLNKTKQLGFVTLYRIRSLRDFGDIKAGYLGGWGNLSYVGSCGGYDDEN